VEVEVSFLVEVEVSFLVEVELPHPVVLELACKPQQDQLRQQHLFSWHDLTAELHEVQAHAPRAHRSL
jgi:hypothetical protein